MIGATVLGAGCYLIYIMENGEYGMKPVSAALQRVEFDHRHDADRNSIIEVDNVNGSGYDLIGIPTGNHAFLGTWISLNKAVGGHVMFVSDWPDENEIVIIQCARVSRLGKRKNVERKVIAFLMQRCQK